MKHRKHIYYGAGGYARHYFKQLHKQYEPLCFCDQSATTDNRQTLFEFPVLPPSAMFDQYPDAPIFISLSPINQYDVQEWLIGEKGVPKQRIVNHIDYTPREATCREWEKMAFLRDDGWGICCSIFDQNMTPLEYFTDRDSPREKVERLLNLRQRLKSSLAKGVPCECHGCPALLPAKNVKSSKALVSLFLSFDSACNLRCCYCDIMDRKTVHVDIPAYRAVIDEMKKADLLNAQTVIGLGNGELTVHPQRAEILSMLLDSRVAILSNCVVYDKALIEHMDINRTTICCSIDAGTRATFMAVKGADLFEQVCQNVSRYSKVAKIDLKYIFLPGMNDNDNDIDGFIALIKRIAPFQVTISRHFYSNLPLPEKTLDMMAKLYIAVRKQSINIVVHDSGLSAAESAYFFDKVGNWRCTT